MLAAGPAPRSVPYRRTPAIAVAVLLLAANGACSELVGIDRYKPCADCPPTGASAGTTAEASIDVPDDATSGDGTTEDGATEGAASDGTSGARDANGEAGDGGGADARAGDASLEESGPDAGAIDAGAVDADAASEASAPTEGGADAPSEAGSTLDMGLIAYYRFDETSGTTSADATGNGHSATLVGGASFGAGLSGNAVTLNGRNEYVSLPANILGGVTSFSVATWVYVNNAPQWSRVFDFGSSTNAYAFLTTNDGTEIRFAITTSGNAQEQRVQGTSQLPTGSWQHVALTLGGGVATLYVQGAQVGQNTNMTLTPASLGSTTQDWLGRSQFSVDPYLTGQIDNFRIYSRALTASEVQTLYTSHL